MCQGPLAEAVLCYSWRVVLRDAGFENVPFASRLFSHFLFCHLWLQFTSSPSCFDDNLNRTFNEPPRPPLIPLFFSVTRLHQDASSTTRSLSLSFCLYSFIFCLHMAVTTIRRPRRPALRGQEKRRFQLVFDRPSLPKTHWNSCLNCGGMAAFHE